jgi:hypothetical protein
MQRSSRDSVRARASSRGSLSISSGCTAKAICVERSKLAAMAQNQRTLCYSAGTTAPALRAGLGAPTRKRRSDSENAPPITITTAPSQIINTIGL